MHKCDIMSQKKGHKPGKENKIMNKTELVEVVSKNAAISKAEAQKVVTALSLPVLFPTAK